MCKKIQNNKEINVQYIIVHNKLQYRREEMNYEQVEVIVPDGDFGC
jgi:hypothetical protein